MKGRGAVTKGKGFQWRCTSRREDSREEGSDGEADLVGGHLSG